MRNLKRFLAHTLTIAMVWGVLFPTVVFADTKSDADASIQFTNANRLKLYNSLSSSGLSVGDVMAKTYVLEDFNEWSTERATMAGEIYDGYTGWEDKAAEKSGGTRARAAGITLPITGVGTYGQFADGNQFLVNLLKITSTSSSAQATIGWFGTQDDGYYGFKNTGSAKKVIDTTPSIKVTSNVSETEEPVYTSTTDSLLYVGDTDNDGKNDVDDWLQFEGTIVLSYDWLVAPVSKVTTELMTLDNIAIHYNRTTADGTSRSNQVVGDFPITGLPIVYYDTNTSTVMMRSHGGIDFSQDNPNYVYFEDETSAKRLRPWKLANDANFFNTTSPAGIALGDWVNLTVVLDVQGTNPQNRVIYQREFLNGELVKNAEGESVCTIKPYDAEYTLSTGSSLPAAPESCTLEGYPYDGKWANWAPAEYYGIGVSFANGQASDGWGGIDNLCYRVYSDTKFDKAVYSDDEISDGKISIDLKTTTDLTDAPKLATAGIIDLGSDAIIKIVKTDVVNDPLVLAGEDTLATVDKVVEMDMTSYSYQGTVTGKKYLDSTSISVSGLETLSGDEAYIVAVDTVDAKEGRFRENVIITDNADVEFIGSELFDFLGNDVSADAVLVDAGEYSIPCNTNKIVFYSADATDRIVTVEGNGNTYTAIFNDGKYTVSLGNLLAQNQEYIVKKNGASVAKIVPSVGSFTYEAYINGSGEPSLRYVNATNDDFSGFLIAYDDKADVKAMNVTIPAGGFGEQSMTGAVSYDNVMFVETLNEGSGESELNSLNEIISSFEGTEATVKGNLAEKEKPVMLLVLKGDEWTTDAELADSIVYIDFTLTKDTAPTTVDGTPYQKGDYQFDVTFPATFATDKYTFMVYSEEMAYKRIVAYGKAEDANTAIATLKTSPQTALASESTRNALGLYFGDVENLYTDGELAGLYNGAATILENEIAINPLPADDDLAMSKVVEIYNQATIAMALTNNKIDSFEKVSESVKALNCEPIKGYWTNNTGIKANKKATWKDSVVQRLKEKTFASISDATSQARTMSSTSFEKALVDAIILQVVLDAESVDAAKNVMQNSFNGLNTLNQSTITTYSAGTVMNQNFASISELQEELAGANQSGNAPPPTQNNNKPSKNDGIGGVTIQGGKQPIAPLPQAVPETKYVFSDMASASWANESVAKLKELGIINGKTENEFAPNDNVTREEFVKMIVLLAGINVEHGELEFDDVNENDWFYNSVKAAKQKRIVSGVSKSHFGVGQKITRQDMAVITANVLAYLNISTAKKNLEFADAEKISDYAKDAVSKLTAKGIINGYDDNTFRPEGFATRAEAAKMLYGLLQLIK